MLFIYEALVTVSGVRELKEKHEPSLYNLRGYAASVAFRTLVITEFFDR
jgi:hypothetical protein